MTILVVLVSTLLLVAVLAWVFQERVAFQPPGGPYPDPGAVKRVSYSAQDGQSLFAYVIGEPAASRGTLIVFHGNADIAVRSIDWAQDIVNRTGITVMLAEYRGYMGLEGSPSYEGVRHDAEAAYRYATDSLQVRPERLAYYGHSLGSGIAAELAVKHPPRVLLLESPFTSAKDMAASMVGRWFTSTVWRFVSRVHFDTARNVESLDLPVSVTHGGRDMIVPSWMGEAVYKSARRKGEWFFVPHAGHNDLRITGGEGYWQWFTTSLAPLTLAK
jgi:fermentation-respiration switch protein FrsA (DUF1100 family)